MDRFWRKVNKTPSCWLWRGATCTNGYGQAWDGKRLVMAHRMSWVLSHGEIPAGDGHHGTCVLHRCDNRLCVNPDHLFLGSNRDNVLDKIAKGRDASPRGRNHPNAMPEAMANMAMDMLAGGMTQRFVSRALGLNKMTVNRMANGKHWAVEGTAQGGLG